MNSIEAPRCKGSPTLPSHQPGVKRSKNAFNEKRTTSGEEREEAEEDSVLWHCRPNTGTGGGPSPFHAPKFKCPSSHIWWAPLDRPSPSRSPLKQARGDSPERLRRRGKAERSMQHQTLSCCGGVRASSPPPLSFRWSKIKREGGRRLPRCARIAAHLELKPPPYSMSSLEPHMSRETLDYHWGRHHRAHVASLNNLIAGTDLDGMGLDEIVVASYNKGNPLPPFVHAAQVWNHDFFWQSIKPGGGGRPSGRLMELIERDFGSFDRMLEEFERAALTHFGSGWAWLVYTANRLDVGNAVNPCPSEKDNKLVVLKSPNAVNPIVWDYSPLLAIDVWEHAYYLDYENRRADYVSIFLEKLVSWEVVSDRLDVAIERAAERAREDETRRLEDDAEITHSEAVEMYLDSDADDSEAE